MCFKFQEIKQIAAKRSLVCIHKFAVRVNLTCIFSSSLITSSILATIVILIILLLFSFKHYDNMSVFLCHRPLQALLKYGQVIFRICTATHVNACDSAQGLYEHRKKVHTESWCWEKNRQLNMRQQSARPDARPSYVCVLTCMCPKIGLGWRQEWWHWQQWYWVCPKV